MKKIMLFSLLTLLSAGSIQLFGEKSCEDNNSCFSAALTAGYVFKHDSEFKEVYGHGIPNILTADFCYYFWNPWGVGVKASYWRAHGRTVFLNQRTLLQEVPFTMYVRGRKQFNCGLNVYASLGGGVIWGKEKSYLGKSRFHKGIGEIEGGLEYQAWRWINITGSLRYLFPRRCIADKKVDVGGLDLRAGIAILF